MHLKPFVFVSTALFAGLALAQPPEAPKKETSRQALTRMAAEGRARAITNLRKELTKFQVSEDDQSAVILLVAQEDAERTLIRRAFYEMSVAEDVGVDDEQLNIFWQDFLSLSAKHRATRVQNAKIIADKLQLAQKPRLNVYLTLRGFIGDEASFLTLVSEFASDTFSREYDIKREINQPRRVVVPDDKP